MEENENKQVNNEINESIINNKNSINDPIFDEREENLKEIEILNEKEKKKKKNKKKKKMKKSPKGMKL